jgi:DNA-binding transcriptional ArsR family regulator
MATLNEMVNSSLDTVFAALADPTRRQILEGLTKGEAPVGRVAKPFRVSAPAISRHLRVLEKAGLIRRKRRGRLHEITIRAEPLREAKDWLETYRRHWEANLDRLAEFLESAAPPLSAGNPAPTQTPKSKEP